MAVISHQRVKGWNVRALGLTLSLFCCLGGLACCSSAIADATPPANLPANWQQLSLPDLVSVVDAFCHAEHRSADNKALRGEIAAHVWKEYLAEEGKFQRLGAEDRDRVIFLVSLVGQDLPASAVASTAQRLRGLAGDSKGVATLEFPAMWHLVVALNVLNVPGAVPVNVVRDWLGTTERWRKLSLEEMRMFMGWCYRNDQIFSKMMREQVAADVWKQFWVDDRHFQALSANDQDRVMILVGVVGADLPVEAVTAMARRLTNSITMPPCGLVAKCAGEADPPATGPTLPGRLRVQC